MSAHTLLLFPDAGTWWAVKRRDPRALALADRHYSRQTPGAVEFMAPGRTLVMLTLDARAVWGAIENLDGAGVRRWRVSIFRNEGAARSSDLIREATDRTIAYWLHHYRRLPPAPLRTEVDPSRVRPKRDPGRCFARAGWREVGATRAGHGRAALLVFEAPGEGARVAECDP